MSEKPTPKHSQILKVSCKNKGLYGVMGTGILLCNSEQRLEPLTYGGTGTLSAQLTQPDAYPERLESGTLNVPGILALEKGVRFVGEKGT